MIKKLLFASLGLFLLKNAQSQSLNFDGINDMVTTPVTYDGTTYANWTYECWAKSPNIPVTYNGYDGPMYGMNTGIIWNHPDVAFYGSATVQDSTNAYFAASFGPINNNEWYHFAATYDGNVLKAYKNGLLISQVITNGGMKSAGGNLVIGKYPAGAQYWTGTIDEARVWNVARTCEEINNSMNIELNGNEMGLMAYYKFNDGVPSSNNTSISTVLNEVGSANDGILSNFNLSGIVSNFIENNPANNTPQTCSNLLGSSLKFDGVDDYVSFINYASFGIGTGTLEAWIKTPNAGTGFRGIVSKVNAYGMFLYNNQLAVYNWANATTIAVGGNLNDNQWHHVAFRFRNGITNGSQLYIDGVATGAPFTYSIANQTIPLTIGNNSQGPGQNFYGFIDEVRIWNRVICQNELIANKNCENNGNIASFHFNQGIADGTNSSETTLINATGSGNGTISGFALNGSESNFKLEAAVVSDVACTFSPYTITVSGDSLISDAPGATYQWYDSLGFYYGSDQFLVPTASGCYWVNVNLGCASYSTSCVNFIVTSVDKVKESASLKIYPNPVKNNLFVDLDEVSIVEVYNVTGVLMISSNATEKKHNIDVSKLPAGLYFVKTANNISKFIKE